MAFEIEKCPYCGHDCEADWVDVDLGYVQCGPYYCTNCGASQIGPCDDLGYDRKLEEEHITRMHVLMEEGLEHLYEPFKVPKGARITQEEHDIGWFKPGSPMGSSVNTYHGQYVKHDEAMALYKLGLLDKKDV